MWGRVPDSGVISRRALSCPPQKTSLWRSLSLRYWLHSLPRNCPMKIQARWVSFTQIYWRLVIFLEYAKYYFRLHLLILAYFFQLLKLLNSNSENPYLIWDNATRAQLTEYLTDQQQQVIKTVSVYSYPPYINIYACVLDTIQNTCVHTISLSYLPLHYLVHVWAYFDFTGGVWQTLRIRVCVWNPCQGTDSRRHICSHLQWAAHFSFGGKYLYM